MSRRSAGQMSQVLPSPDRTRRSSPGLTGWPTWLAQLLLLTLLTCVIRAPSWHPSVVAVDGDEAVYLVIAQQWLGGHLPYVTAGDPHPVGLAALLPGLAGRPGDGQFHGPAAASVPGALAACPV